MSYDFGVAAVVFGIYAATLVASMLFAVSPKRFSDLEDSLCYDFIPGYPVSVIETTVDGVDMWAKRNHHAVGGALAVCSLINLQLAWIVYAMLMILPPQAIMVR